MTDKAARAREMLAACRLCPRECGVNRLSGQRGYCGAGAVARVAAVSLHYGEEPPISGTGGAGTVFFSHCNMRCLFCQNYPISQFGVGKEMAAHELADKLLWLQDKGAHNVNVVTPTPHVPQLIEALDVARGIGLKIPMVYNTNGYESLETLRLLDGVVDIYLPDMKYRSEELAAMASDTPDYPVHNERAIAEMVRQVGPLSVGEDGIARRGVLIRHLVLPGRVDETEDVLAYIRDVYGPEMPLSLMGQYFPAYKAADFTSARRGQRGGAERAIGVTGGPAPDFGRKLTAAEYDRAIETAIRLDLRNVAIQDDETNIGVTR